MGDDCRHTESAQPGLEGAALANAVAAAAVKCERTRERLTPPRRRVLELLLEADGPMKAYDLIAAYGQDGEPAKPPTVYRALDFLERLGFAHRIDSLNAFVACFDPERSHDAGFLICESCRSVTELADPALDHAIRTSVTAQGFHPSRTVVEISGTCAACAAKATAA